MRLEIAVRNVKWLQCMVEHPEAHVQVLGSVFGRVVFGKSVEHTNLNNEGKPAEPVNPFTQGFFQDIELFRPVPGANDFFTEWSGDFRLIFNDDGVRSLFLKLDSRELRAVFWDCRGESWEK